MEKNMLIEAIQSNNDFCTGCNRCVRECPMETANITYQDNDEKLKVRIDHERCILCGRCITACKHNARYYADDTERFFEDLIKGEEISVITAPAIRTNIPEYKRLFTYLKQLGIKKIYDVSLGADICVWAHVRYTETQGASPIITQPCPAVVLYCELYHHELLKWLSPVHSPMACTSIYMKKYRGIGDRIAAITPCIAKSSEFNDTGLAQYNITFEKLIKYLDDNNIPLPDEETDYDHDESGLGSLFPMPGGLKENIEFFTGKKLHIAKLEGYDVFEKLDKYAGTPEDFLPDIFDVLNCSEGCNIGPASTNEKGSFEIDKNMNAARKKATEESRREHYNSVYEEFDKTFDPADFIREYQPILTPFPQITNADISKAFELLGKNDYESQNVDCSACGSETCFDMARKIALNVNIPINCIVKSMEDAKISHEENLDTHRQLAIMEQMHEADERTRVMLDSTPLCSHFWDRDFNILECNQAAANLFGMTNKQEYIDRFFELTPKYQPDGSLSKDLLNQHLEKAFEEGHLRVNFMRQSASGEQVPVEITFVRVDYKGEEIIAGYCRDLREHNRMLEEIDAASGFLNAALANNELQLAKLHLAVQATKIGLWDMEVNHEDPVNPNNTLNFSNELRHMLGFTDETDFPNLISSWSDRIHPEDKEATLSAFAAHLLDKTGGTPYDVENRLRMKNGEYGYYRASGETIRDQNGRALRVAGALVDNTETKNILLDTERQKIEAEAANEAKTLFLSTMSHEIRTPMNAILGITEINLQNSQLAPEIKDSFSKIYASGEMLLGIINNILDLSKIETGKMELSISKYSIASLLIDTAQLNVMRKGSKPIDFELDVDANMPSTFIGDELRIKQILNNLLSNAFKYTQKGKVSMSVEFKPVDGQKNVIDIIFVISDTGQGMTEEQVKSLFEEYSRFNLETNRTTEGTGLGMSITQKLLTLMNGEIKVESEYGKGSVFTVRLPQIKIGSEIIGEEIAQNLREFRKSSIAQMDQVRIERETMPYGRVLVVDDVDINIYVAQGLLAPYEINVDSSESGFDAIEKIKNGNEYDIIFMDHMMPQMDGVEATKIIRDMGYTQPIVALTADAVSGQADMFLANGFDEFVSKPIDIRKLDLVLNKFVRDK